ncbi:ISL3 family transposase [Phyllobacterium phragmitis]|uniref:ISL3 family transposase n=1 Tax=Phyllobacterium phragmitis TaxID=2670329 RepID=A0A2S9IQX0_9HYPH|nr:ISL3 family transposase [Phyllobacterium phragmitis]PRD42915.1 ISL3 family transposase [Phyllobacterium phragmitis]
MRTQSKWSPGPGIKVLSVVSNGDGDWVVSACGPSSGICPDCRQQSGSRHGWSYRSLQDLPIQGNEVTVWLQLSRWRCTYRQCGRKTFTDRVPAIASPYARRTTRVADIVGLLGHSTGGRPGERLMRRLGMSISDDTILRHLKRNASRVGDEAPARIVGIDDWSWRKSWRYGTIIVDLERRKVMDILEGRSVVSVAQWLKRHPSIEIVSRDRCGLYVQAAREGAPQASQVADRFHLIQNLRLAIEEQMSLSGRATGRALLPDEDIETDHDDRALHEQAPETPWRNQLRRAHRQSRKEVFETVHALSKEGLTCSEIARRTGYGRRSIAKWLTFETLPDRRRGALQPTSPLYFEAFLTQCWKDGNRRGRHLFHDIKNRGYTGSFSNLERLLATWRRAEKPGEDHVAPFPSVFVGETPDNAPVRDPHTGHLISPVVAATLCIKPRGALTINQARKVDALKQRSQTFAVLRSFSMRFRGIFHSRTSAKLEDWIEDAIHSGLAFLARFARVLRRDIDAVCNAIDLPWSNGQAEGQINRLKTIKRAMYGRAGPERLRARMMPIKSADLHTK